MTAQNSRDSKGTNIACDLDISSLKNAFEQDGFVIIPNFLKADELRELESQAKQTLGEFPSNQDSRSIKSKRAFAGTRKNLQHESDWFDEQLRQGTPYQTIKAVLDSELHPATAAYFERIPGEANGIPPHFDGIPDRKWGATIWIALDPARVSNGCLYYARGSHRELYPGKVGIQDFDTSSLDATPVEIDPGDAAIHSSLTVHWSNPNHSQDRRRAISYFYWAKQRTTSDPTSFHR